MCEHVAVNCVSFCRLNVEDSGEDENNEQKSSKESREPVSSFK